MPQKANLISPRSCTRKTFKFVKPFVVSNEFREARTPRRSSSRACFNARNSVKSVKASGYQYASFTFRPPPIWKILQDKSWNKSSLNCFVPRISSTNSQQLLRLLLQVGTAENQPEKTYTYIAQTDDLDKFVDWVTWPASAKCVLSWGVLTGLESAWTAWPSVSRSLK